MSGVPSRPCSICRKRFVPNPHVGKRQRTCAAPDCKRALHARACKKWHRDNALLVLEDRLRQRVIAPPKGPSPRPSADPIDRINLALLAHLEGSGLLIALRLVLLHLVSALRDQIHAQPSGDPVVAPADAQTRKRDE